jgi:hypothetical protein
VKIYCAEATAKESENENVPPPAGRCAASILWNHVRRFGRNSKQSEIARDQINILELTLFTIFDLITID